MPRRRGDRSDAPQGYAGLSPCLSPERTRAKSGGSRGLGEAGRWYRGRSECASRTRQPAGPEGLERYRRHEVSPRRQCASSKDACNGSRSSSRYRNSATRLASKATNEDHPSCGGDESRKRVKDGERTVEMNGDGKCGPPYRELRRKAAYVSSTISPLCGLGVAA